MSDGEGTQNGAIRAVNIKRRSSQQDLGNGRVDHQDKLRKDHFMKADSDQINLDALLQAVLDISDRLHDQEEKLDKSRPKDKRRPRSAYGSSSNLKQEDVDDGLSFASDLNSSGRQKHTRPVSAVSVGSGRPNEKRNLSFANSKVDEIDRENQRLLKKILRSKAKNSTQTRASGPVRVKSSAEVNRSKFQQQIESENLALLRRLESVKPTKTLSKDHLLREHFKQTQYSKNASKTASRPSSATSFRSGRSSSLTNLSDIDCRSEISTRSRSSIGSAKSSRSRCSSGRSSVRSVRTPVKAVWEPGW